MAALDTALSALMTGFSGRIVGPDDADYDKARTVTYGGFDKHPGAIVKVKSAVDVQAVVNAAREGGVEFVVRSGGHSNAGHSTTDGGLVLDLRDMHAISVDVNAGTLWAETGAMAIDVTKAAEKHGMVVGFGDAGTVGIGGITLGGGVGYMARKYGLTIDALLAAEIVTADGRLLMVDATHEPDLFWALRGGGGNFGVVTRLQYNLNPLPEFTGGMLILSATAETVSGFIAAAHAAPEALSTICNVMPCPPMPFVPEEVHGKMVIFGMLAFAGSPGDAEKTLAPFRALAKPHADMIKSGSYAELMYPPEDDDYHPTASSHTMFIDRVGPAEAKMILDELAASDAVFKVVQLRVLGGAVSLVPSDATAYAHRSAPILTNIAAFYTTPEDRLKQEAWVGEFGKRLEQDEKGAYVNFLALDGAERLAAAYPPKTLARLREVKAKYDPKNLFRMNQNIAPAA
ncbi:MAG: FAD-binding oxidoreductase [Devosia sp.]